MRYETITWTEKYKIFDVGERVIATSPRCSLAPGWIYVVTKYIPPTCPGDHPVVFVEGRETGINAEYVGPAEKGSDDASVLEVTL